jgi:signal recognition particle receptor subunit beta
MRVIVTGPGEADGMELVSVLSDTEIVEQERKIPNPFSATKEEAVLLTQMGRREWDDLALQMYALTAYKRYDFTWSALLREVDGIIVLVDTSNAEDMSDTHRVLRLLAMLAPSGCLVGVKQQDDSDDGQLAEIRTQLNTEYPMLAYEPTQKESAERLVRAWVDQMPPPPQPSRKRTR